MAGTISRRGALGAALASVAATSAPAQPAERFSAVSVDVAPLRAQGVGPFADLLRSALQAELALAFADRMGPGPRLVVRITGLSMPAYAGGGVSRFGFSGTPNDYLDGEALVLGPRGQILVRHPQLSALPANSGGAWYDPASEGRRVQALAAHYAGWLRRASF